MAFPLDSFKKSFFSFLTYDNEKPATTEATSCLLDFVLSHQDSDNYIYKYIYTFIFQCNKDAIIYCTCAFYFEEN